LGTQILTYQLVDEGSNPDLTSGERGQQFWSISWRSEAVILMHQRENESINPDLSGGE
jgi:hypothetical protein